MTVLFMTGAGISASAGIPTYREGSSSWRNPELEKKSHANRYGNHLDELWDEHWGPIGQQMALSHPTAAHLAIADFQRDCGVDTIVATQNIDNLHERAGSDNISHVHGTMDIICMKCKKIDHDASWKGHGAPICHHCGYSKTRPNAILFGEPLKRKAFEALTKFSRDTSHIVVIGTSLNVFPFADLVMDNFHNPRIKTILINKGETAFSQMFNVVIGQPADGVTKMVLDIVQDEINKG